MGRGGGFGGAASMPAHGQRERERERERERGENNPLNELTEEQREEINEAVPHPSTFLLKTTLMHTA